FSVASFVTFRLAPATLVIAPVEVNVRLLAVLAPESAVALFRSMIAAPVLLNVSEPNDRLSPAWLPSVTVVPEKLALPLTLRVAPAPFVSAPAALIVAVPLATFSPARLRP